MCGLHIIDQQFKFCHALKECRYLAVMSDLSKHSLDHWHCRCHLAVTRNMQFYGKALSSFTDSNLTL